MPPGGGKLRRGQGFGNGEARGIGEQNALREAVEAEGKSPCRLNRTTEKDGTEGQLSRLCLVQGQVQGHCGRGGKGRLSMTRREVKRRQPGMSGMPERGGLIKGAHPKRGTWWVGFGDRQGRGSVGGVEPSGKAVSTCEVRCGGEDRVSRVRATSSLLLLTWLHLLQLPTSYTAARRSFEKKTVDTRFCPQHKACSP